MSAYKSPLRIKQRNAFACSPCIKTDHMLAKDIEDFEQSKSAQHQGGGLDRLVDSESASIFGSPAKHAIVRPFSLQNGLPFIQEKIRDHELTVHACNITYFLDGPTNHVTVDEFMPWPFTHVPSFGHEDYQSCNTPTEERDLERVNSFDAIPDGEWNGDATEYHEQRDNDDRRYVAVAFNGDRIFRDAWASLFRFAGLVDC